MFVLLTFPVVPNLLSLSTQRCRIDNNFSPSPPPPVFTAKGRPWERWTPWPWGTVKMLGMGWGPGTTVESSHGGLRRQAALDHINTFRGSFFRWKWKKRHFWNGSFCFVLGTHRQSQVADCFKLYFQYSGEGREKEEWELEEILTSDFHFRGATEHLDLKSGLI